MGDSLICPRCKNGTMKWVDDEVEDLFEKGIMKCVNCKETYVGFPGWMEAHKISINQKGEPKMQPGQITRYTVIDPTCKIESEITHFINLKLSYEDANRLCNLLAELPRAEGDLLPAQQEILCKQLSGSLGMALTEIDNDEL